MNRRPLLVRDTELLAAPTIASQMPVVLANGARWESFAGHCSGCGLPVERDLMTGMVSRPFANVAVVEAAGQCKPCNLVSRYSYRLHEDMRITGRDAEGRWATWLARPTLAALARRWLAKFLRALCS